MNIKPGPTHSSKPGGVKSTFPTPFNHAAPKPTRQEAAPPSEADIATKAYEIWLAREPAMGHASSIGSRPGDACGTECPRAGAGGTRMTMDGNLGAHGLRVQRSDHENELPNQASGV